MFSKSRYNGVMAILDDRSLDFISNSIEQTIRLGVRLGELLQPRDVLGLTGEVGVGKTVLARGVGRGWGTPLRVTSPTFIIVNEYPRMGDSCVLYHADCYRLDQTADIVTAGLEDIINGEGALVIEWAERVEKWLPEDCLWISFRYLTQTRRGLRFTATGARSENLLSQFRKNAFGF